MVPSPRNLVAIVIACISIALFATNLEAVTSDDKPDPRFGVAEAFWSPEEAAMLNVGWERILFYWREIQPLGPEDWNTLHVREEWLVEAERNGRMVVGLLKNTAPWASEDGTEAGVPIGLELPIDDPGNYWANYARRIARYYGPRDVHHWIIWNEPEIPSDVYGFEFAGSVEEYYRLLKVAYLVIKEEDPEATIHLAGVTWWHDQTFLRRFLEVAKADPEANSNDWFFDVISLHIYFRPDTVLSIIESVGELLDEYGLEKSIWVNETNAPPNMDPQWPVDRPAFKVDLEQQAWFIIQAHALGFATGADRIAVYKLADVLLPTGAESFGLIRQDFSKRPAYQAYATTIEYLEGFNNVSLKQHPHYYVATFTGREFVTRIAWARTPQDVVLSMPALDNQARLVNYLGESAVIQASDGGYQLLLQGAVCHEECLIGGAPIIVVEQHRVEDIDQIETSVAIPGFRPTAVLFATATPPSTFSPTPSDTPTSTITPVASETPVIISTPRLAATSLSTPRLDPTHTANELSSAGEIEAKSTATPGNSEQTFAGRSLINEATADENDSEAYYGLYALVAALLVASTLGIYLLKTRGKVTSGD